MPFLIIFIISNALLFGSAYAEAIISDVLIHYESNDARYDSMIGSMARPDVYITLSQGNRLVYKSNIVEDAQVFNVATSINLSPHESLVIKVWDDDVKVDDLLMQNEILMPQHGSEGYHFETTESFVSDSHGGKLRVHVKVKRDMLNLDLVRVEKSISDTFNAISYLVEQHTIDDYQIKDSNSVVEFKAAGACINQLKPLYVEKYKIMLNELLSSFPVLLSYHIYDDENDNSFVEWVTGWLSGYYQAYLKAKDLVANHTSIQDYISMDSDSLEKQIQKKYEELAFYPSIMSYNTGTETIEANIFNDMISKCSSILISEQIKISNLYQISNFSFQIKKDGIIQSTLKSIDDSMELKDSISSLYILDIANKFMPKKTISSGAGGSLGVLIGTKAGLAIQGKILSTLAAKGFMGKTSVFFFKIGSSKVIQTVGLGALSKVIASKAAAAAGGKLLILMAERVVGVVVSTVSLGLGVIFDYGLSEAIKAATANGLAQDITSQNNEILNSLKSSLYESINSKMVEISNSFGDELKTRLVMTGK